MTSAAAQRLMHLTPDGPDRFTAVIPSRGDGRLFGGQIAGQAVLAACRTVDPSRRIHSFHSYFILAGKPDVPVTYVVDRSRDGRSFTTRHVSAMQDGAAIFEMIASFQIEEDGPHWQQEGQSVGSLPDPIDVKPELPMYRFAQDFDVRPLNLDGLDTWRLHPYWFKARENPGDEAAMHAALLTYVSDMAFMSSCRPPEMNEPLKAGASLDHAIWFHHPPRIDEWTLFRSETVAFVGTRGMAQGSMVNQQGIRIATIAQEALLRV